MDFQYDPYRKKYTVKAEEVEEEEDFIEDNYDNYDFWTQLIMELNYNFIIYL